MAFCARCGAAIPSGTRFCASCGATTIRGPAEEAPDSPAVGVRLWWVLGASLSGIGLVMLAAGSWLASTVPGNSDVNAWSHSHAAQIALVSFVLGCLVELIGFGISLSLVVSLVASGGFGLLGDSDVDRASRIKEMCWNVVGVLIPIVTLVTIVILSR